MRSNGKASAQLVVPRSVQRQAGIKTGDRLKFQASNRTITITAIDEPFYEPTKNELAAIRKGEAEIAKGQFVTLTELLDGQKSNSQGSPSRIERKSQ